ncbi:transglycosylase SLT domain-containing protein [Betaproteobacteria bacterium SCN2]|nr:transglycosylase SLT domain-containing protein [Betaproteobacteria bacterium SCN2]
MFKSLLVLLVLLAAPPTRADAGDDFLAAREAWAKGDMRGFERLAEKIPRDYALRPYIEYWGVARQLTDDSRVTDFLALYPDSWLGERLRGEWLKDLGRRENWTAYLAEFPRLARPEVTHACFARRAELAQGDRSALGQAIALWYTGKDMPSACTPLFASLLSQGWLTEEDVWKRLRLAFEAGNPGVAKSLLVSIPEGGRPVSVEIDRAYREPSKYLAGRLDWSKRAQREPGLFALSRLAKTDSVAAARILQPLLPQLSEVDQQYAWGLLAVEAARRHEPQATQWFPRTGGLGLSQFQREWWVRAALRAGDWRSVLWAISGMDEDSRNQPAWQYWQGRALKALGQVPGANRIFAPLSREHHYYGLLASEELGAVMGAQPVNIKVSGEEIGAVARDAGIVRALTLYRLGLRTEAANEWIWAVRNFNDRQLLAAAELARNRDWHDRAINTAERTREQHDFDLRFIAPYRELASREAKENRLDEAWVYGLMRQESRFVNVAKSGVGAAGLMQIMPATGRWIAQRLGIKGFDTRSLNEPETNIRFGTYYLRYVLESLDGQPVLATAAYNAGPGRAQRWRDSKPMEGAIYIESIPFSETRDYVKKVMSNAMYYALRFGQPSVLLVDRLGTIPGRSLPARPEGANDRQPGLESGEGES